MYAFTSIAGIAHAVAGQYDKAIELCRRRCARTACTWRRTGCSRSRSRLSGRIDEARRAAGELLALEPDADGQRLPAALPGQRQRARRLLRGARRRRRSGVGSPRNLAGATSIATPLTDQRRTSWRSRFATMATTATTATMATMATTAMTAAAMRAYRASTAYSGQAHQPAAGAGAVTTQGEITRGLRPRHVTAPTHGAGDHAAQARWRRWSRDVRGQHVPVRAAVGTRRSTARTARLKRRGQG